jgi:hypothetical protein
VINQARRDAIRREFGPGTVARMLLDELEKVEASARAALAACQHQNELLRVERDELAAKIHRATVALS